MTDQKKDAAENTASSLLSHCIPCKAKCCHDNLIVVHNVAYKKIIEAGHPDYFHRVLVLPHGLFYVLDHKNLPQNAAQKDDAQNTAPTTNDAPAPCPYLQNSQCSIEAVKPDSCSIFPAVRLMDYDGKFHSIGYNTGCPASQLAQKLQSFHSEAARLINKSNHEVPIHAVPAIIDAYRQQTKQQPSSPT